MRKQLLLTCLVFASVSTFVSAQMVIQGGNMEDANAWTVIDVGDAYDPSEVTFNYTDDKPAKGQGGCLSIAASGVTRNFIYQPVTLRRGHTYFLSCALKNAGDAGISNYWLEINLVKREPVLVGEGTSSDFGVSRYEYQMGMHYWRSIGSTAYDRIPAGYDDLMEKTLPFDWKGVLAGGKDSVITNPRKPNFVGKHGDSIIFTIPDTVSTEDWYLLIKAGAFMTAGAAEPRYNWLLDELILWDMAEPLPTSVKSVSQTNQLSISPNPLTGNILRINGNTVKPITYRIFDLSGKVVMQGITYNNTIAAGRLKSGMYGIILSTGSENITSKFVKQ